MTNVISRFIAVYKCEKEQLPTLILDLEARAIAVVEHLETIKTLVLAGDAQTILALPRSIPSIESVEPEGFVRVPE